MLLILKHYDLTCRREPALCRSHHGTVCPLVGTVGLFLFRFAQSVPQRRKAPSRLTLSRTAARCHKGFFSPRPHLSRGFARPPHPAVLLGARAPSAGGTGCWSLAGKGCFQRSYGVFLMYESKHPWPTRSFGPVSLCSINSKGWLVHGSLLLATRLRAVVVQKFPLIKRTSIVPCGVPLLTEGFVAVVSQVQTLLRSDSAALCVGCGSSPGGSGAHCSRLEGNGVHLSLQTAIPAKFTSSRRLPACLCADAPVRCSGIENPFRAARALQEDFRVNFSQQSLCASEMRIKSSHGAVLGSVIAEPVCMANWFLVLPQCLVQYPAALLLLFLVQKRHPLATYFC